MNAADAVLQREALQGKEEDRNASIVPQYTCPTSGNLVTPTSLVQHDGIVWYGCSDPIHTFNGESYPDLHVAPLSVDEMRAIVRKVRQS